MNLIDGGISYQSSANTLESNKTQTAAKFVGQLDQASHSRASTSRRLIVLKYTGPILLD